MRAKHAGPRTAEHAAESNEEGKRGTTVSICGGDHAREAICEVGDLQTASGAEPARKEEVIHALLLATRGFHREDGALLRLELVEQVAIAARSEVDLLLCFALRLELGDTGEHLRAPLFEHMNARIELVQRGRLQSLGCGLRSRGVHVAELVFDATDGVARAGEFVQDRGEHAFLLLLALVAKREHGGE